MEEAGQLDKTCPLCGEDNRCAMADGREVTECWCKDVSISAEVLAAIPAEAVGKYCICAACAGGKEAESDG